MADVDEPVRVGESARVGGAACGVESWASSGIPEA